MAKRRTKKQKQKTEKRRGLENDYKISWSPRSNSKTPEPRVKGQIQKADSKNIASFKNSKTAEVSVKDENLESAKKDILKSLKLVSLMLALEIMLYLGWVRFF